MTPGDPVAITRGARVQFRAVVERIAWPGGDIILTDVRRRAAAPLWRPKQKSSSVVNYLFTTCGAGVRLDS